MGVFQLPEMATIPAPLPGPTGERLPSADETRLIQWIYSVQEDDYGPLTRAAVKELQSKNGIPVDSEVKIGPRTWGLILDAYRSKVGTLPWQVPTTPLQLDGTTTPEQWLRSRLQHLNSVMVPDAARRYVRNCRILARNEAGNPPASPIPLPAPDDPEVQAAIDGLRWDQAKINRLWEGARQIGIDPRMMLAVLFQEGTGSFNTNADVPVHFWDERRSAYWQGGSGPQPDFELDLKHAMERHILAKIRAYGCYAADFRAVTRAEGLGDGNVFQYVNYNVPWVKSSGWKVRPGPYATDINWWRGLSYYFDSLVMPGATQAYSEYLASHPLEVPFTPPSVKFIKTHNGTGETEEILGQPWIEAAPLGRSPAPRPNAEREFVEALQPQAKLLVASLGVDPVYEQALLVKWAHKLDLRLPELTEAVAADEEVALSDQSELMSLMRAGAPLGEALGALSIPEHKAADLFRALLPYMSAAPAGRGRSPLAVARLTGPGKAEGAASYGFGGSRWLTVVPGRFGGVTPVDLLVYDRLSGEGRFYSVGDDGQLRLFRRHSDWRRSWTQIIPGRFGGRGETDLLFWDRRAGQAEIYSVVDAGGLEYIGQVTGWAPGWLQIIPGNFTGSARTELLVYDAQAGTITIYTPDGHGGLNAAVREDGWSRSWALLVPGRFTDSGYTDLLCYDRLAGFGAFLRADGQGGFSTVREHAGWRKSWASIVPGRFGGESGLTDLLFWERSTGYGEFYAPDGQGDIRYLGPAGGWNPLASAVAAEASLVFYDGAPGAGYERDDLMPLPDEVVPLWDNVPEPANLPWDPWEAAIRSEPVNRSPVRLEAVIRQLRVGTALRYRPNRFGKQETYCNIFLWDVTAALDALVPHWVNPATGNPTPRGQGMELDANGVCDWLVKHGPRYGWRPTDAEAALAFANAGKPAIAVWKNPGGIGHVAVVRPGAAHPSRGVPIAQAGLSNFDTGYLRDGFGSHSAQVIYYVHD